MSGYQISTNTSSILLIGGHDPSGAGMQADIETIIMHKLLELLLVIDIILTIANLLMGVLNAHIQL